MNEQKVPCAVVQSIIINENVKPIGIWKQIECTSTLGKNRENTPYIFITKLSHKKFHFIFLK